MSSANAIRSVGDNDAAGRLFQAVGVFLRDQRLDPNPTNYTFAWHVLANPAGPLALAVNQLTDGGIRLTQKDIDSLGADVDTDTESATIEGLVARTQMKVETFVDLMGTLHEDTRGFGRDLQASAEAIAASRDRPQDGIALEEVARITASMIERVHVAETQLDSATREASGLREDLEAARKDARRDPLTGLPNRRAFAESFAAQINAGSQLCLAMCDIDHFKQVNDRFGHQVGDRVLKAIGDTMAKHSGGHLVSRYGGEEFAILFSGLTLEQADAMLTVAREATAGRFFRTRDGDSPVGHVTFSAGLIALREGEVQSDAFHRADRNLYAAKSAGRNCIVSN